MIYLSVDQFLDLNSDTYLATVNHTGQLAGGDSYSVNTNIQLPPGLTGSFYVFVDTDPILHPAASPRAASSKATKRITPRRARAARDH